MKLIVSLCNKKASVDKIREKKMLYPNVFLLEVDTEKEQIKPIEIRWWTWKPKGVTGLYPYKDGFLCLLQAKTHKLFYIDKKYRVKGKWPLKKVKDGHSIVVWKDKIYIASTGNNSIVEFLPDKNEEKIFWQYNSSETDTIHVNSMVWHNDQMIISAFGKKDGDQWITARNGFLKNIHEERIIKSSLFHPHTLIKTPEGIFFCESAKKRIMPINGYDALNVEKGYVRGLLITKDEIAVGISHARTRSKSTGKLNDMDSELMKSFQSGCGIKIYKRRGSKLRDAEFVKFIDLYSYSNEIYDLISI